ncbi:MAG: tRNA uridine-5-carboxymethylaminomethyl(34) synthesis GTPase MnmE [Desulfobacteraceae bacterium]|nr:tRNA uridine-5-carboxymethylaminomethyl(34) synthesis GTPase MnmE [Desulfobacteraceae bacterium]
MTNDTIAAISTPPGNGGIGVIRISGLNSLDIISKLFGRTKKGSEDCKNFQSHKVHHGYIFDSDTAEIIDEVLVIPMLAPSSYTTEDVVEIQAHSGNIVMRSILDLVVSHGARLAEPGEFTKRAFLNKRIDLTQAEAVADIINAKSIKSLRVAASQSSGTLQKSIKGLKAELLDLLTLLEAAIDFPDDIDNPFSNQQGLSVVEKVLADCQRYIRLYDDACFIRDGIKLAICGAPNVGKSSLMNRLLEEEKAIVTSIPGTTRDPIQESLNISGIPFTVSDTAGIHSTNDLVEIIGMKKAKEHISDADLILYMKELGQNVSEKELNQVIPKDKKVLFVINKIDLVKDKKLPKLPDMPKPYQDIPKIGISALENQGIDELRKMVINISIKDLDVSLSGVIPNIRHKEALKEVVINLKSAEQGMLKGQHEETLAFDIKNSINALGKITGETAEIDILDNIFSNFCIGK